MVEVRFKPADVGSVADGGLANMIKFPSGPTDPASPSDGDLFFNTTESKFKRYNAGITAWVTIDMVDSIDRLADDLITNAKIKSDAAIVKSKLAPLAIVDADVDAIGVAKVTDAVAGTGTTGDKKILKLGWDSATEEVVVDHEV